jgi:beta-lactamase class A
MSEMKSKHGLRLAFLLALAAMMAVTAGDAVAKTRYHVSYVWAHDLNNVRDYRRKVGDVLGPEVAEDLKVVAKGDMYGVVYFRSGDSADATSAARSHTRLLRQAGLEAAAPMQEGRWTVLEPTGTPTDRSRPETLPETRRDREIRDIESAVEQYVKRLRRQGKLAADERTAWSVYDFTSGEKLVTINEDVRFQAASLIKPFIAAAFFHKVKRGDFIYGPRSRRHMERMIHWSNNRSTNWVMRQVGGPAAVQRILQRHYPTIFRDTRIVEYIPAGGKTYRNKASAHEYSRFLVALWNDDIPGAKEIRRIMGLRGSNRIFTGAPDIPQGTKVYNKTGSTAHLCGDIGVLIVKGPDGKTYPYTIVGIIEKRHKARNYTAWIRSRGDVIRDVSNIVYKGVARYHDFDKVMVGAVQ